MADLIPDEAIALALAAGGIAGEPGDLCWEEMLAALEAAAPLILAAELDRWAEHCEAEATKYAHLRSDHGRKFAAADALRNLETHHLRARAADLRSTTEGDATHG